MKLRIELEVELPNTLPLAKLSEAIDATLERCQGKLHHLRCVPTTWQDREVMKKLEADARFEQECG